MIDVFVSSFAFFSRCFSILILSASSTAFSGDRLLNTLFEHTHKLRATKARQEIREEFSLETKIN